MNLERVILHEFNSLIYLLLSFASSRYFSLSIARLVPVALAAPVVEVVALVPLVGVELCPVNGLDVLPQR